MRIRIYDDSGDDKFGIYMNDSLITTLTDNDIPHGGVAFAGDRPLYDNIKIGYDNNGDGDP